MILKELQILGYNYGKQLLERVLSLALRCSHHGILVHHSLTIGRDGPVLIGRDGPCVKMLFFPHVLTTDTAMPGTSSRITHQVTE